MKKFLVRLLVFIFAVFMIYNIIGLLKPNVKTHMANTGTMEKSFSLSGFIVRDETVMTSSESGVLESRVKENEVVKKNKVVATVYKGDIDEESKNKITEINNRINELTLSGGDNVHNNDAYRVEEGITKKITDIIMASNARDAEKVSALKDNLRTLSDKKFATNQSKMESTDLLNELKSEKEYYENKFNSTKIDMVSPAPGMYSTNIDGYEGLLSVSNADKMTVAEYRLLKKKKISKEDVLDSKVVCKVMNNYQWSVVTMVSGNIASELKTGKTVYIRFSDSSEDVKARVSYISPQDSGKYVVTVTSTENCDYAFNNRQAEFDLVCEKYTGLKIPVSTISVKEDGKTGVYVLVDGTLKFKEVNVLYKDSKDAIVEVGNGKENYLLLYDEIVTQAKDYTEGKRIE